MEDKENLLCWWGEDRENLRYEPPGLDWALARVHPEGTSILNVINYLFCIYPNVIRCFSFFKAFDLHVFTALVKAT